MKTYIHLETGSYQFVEGEFETAPTTKQLDMLFAIKEGIIRREIERKKPKVDVTAELAKDFPF